MFEDYAVSTVYDPHDFPVRLFCTAVQSLPPEEQLDSAVTMKYVDLLQTDYFPRLIAPHRKCSLRATEYRRCGNSECKRGNFGEAFRYFTKSVAVAPPDSDELAFAYANRSVSLLKLERYRAAIVDINRALKNYPVFMKGKLYDRKAECISKMKAANEYNLFSVMYCSERCRDEAFNLYHRIECEMLPMAVELKCDRMDFLVLRILLIASKQGNEIKNLKKHSDYGHPFLEKYFSIVNKKYKTDDYANIHNLENQIAKIPFLACYPWIMKASILLHVVRSSSFFDKTEKPKPKQRITETESYVGALLLKYYFAMQINAYEVNEVVEEEFAMMACTTKSVKIGGAICTLLRLVNHSCDPNVWSVWHKNYLVCYAIQPIAANEQILDSYGPVYYMKPLKDRQQFCQERYFFECQCPACKLHWPLFTDLPSKELQTPLTKAYEQKLDECQMVLKMDPSLINGEQYDFLCKHITMLYNTHQKPWKEYAEYQEAFKMLLAYKANHYRLQSDLIL